MATPYRDGGAVTRYNEIEPYAADWLENLIDAGHITTGVVDRRSIRDLCPEDLFDHDRVHFFAGIGVWDAALRGAHWPEGLAVWTGSCPCQPFSGAGKRKGFADERHLWPAWFNLVSVCRPPVIIGEQVEGPAGRAWLDLVFSDLEGCGYACGAVVFPAAGVGAPHIRHRTYWMAHAARIGERPDKPRGNCGDGQQLAGTGPGSYHRDDGAVGRVADASHRDDGLGNARRRGPGSADDGAAGRMGIADSAGSLTRRTPSEAARHGHSAVAASRGSRPGPVNGFWYPADWLYCRDNKWRPVEPGTFALAYGVANRVGKLRAYGNAICLPQAQAFVEIVLSVLAPGRLQGAPDSQRKAEHIKHHTEHIALDG